MSTKAMFPKRPNTCGRRAVEVITKHDTICEGEKTARERIRTNLRSRRTNDGELAWFDFIGRARAERTRKKKRGDIGPLCLPSATRGEGVFIHEPGANATRKGE
jgi:hypothetical protein